MGWPSSHEHDQEKRDDAAFVDHQMPPDLKAIHIAPVTPPARKRSKMTERKPGEGAPRDMRKYVEALERRVRKLEIRLKEAQQALAAEKAHVDQLKRRQNKTANLLIEAQIRNLTAEHDAQVAQLKKMLASKDQELEQTRKLAMKKLFS